MSACDNRARHFIQTSRKESLRVVKLLTPFVVDENLLYTKTRNFHWNVVGPQYSALLRFG